MDKIISNFSIGGIVMDKKPASKGPIINGIQGELKPVDYKFIEDLTKNAGLTEDYLRECEEAHKKHNQENQKKPKIYS